jgi:hypothetical protein
MPLIVDASVALAWALPDESSAYADGVLAVVEQGGLRVLNSGRVRLPMALLLPICATASHLPMSGHFSRPCHT